MKRLILFVASALAVAGFGRSAQADFLTLEDCETCHGATVTLDVVETGDGQFDVTYEIDFTDFDRRQAEQTDHTVLTSIGFKAFARGLTADNVMMISAPDASWADPVLANVSNSNNCAFSSQADLICTMGALEVPDSEAALQVFSWNFEISGAELKTDEWSIRGAFGPANGWLLSESGAPIPEPTSAILFAVGFSVAGSAVRRSKT